MTKQTELFRRSDSNSPIISRMARDLLAIEKEQGDLAAVTEKAELAERQALDLEQWLHERKMPLSCGNAPGRNRKRRPSKHPGTRYTRDSYRRAVQYACRKAGIPQQRPHQLRHSADTAIRKTEGIEVARIIIGHRSAGITTTYAELDHGWALQVMQNIG